MRPSSVPVPSPSPSRAARRLVLTVAIAWLAVSAPARARDWSKSPAIAVETGAPGDLLALGDVHGDYDRLVTLLVAGKVLKEKPSTPGGAKWAAGNARLVCTGDLIDKGSDSIDVILLLKALQADAAASGGRVIVTMGNHEAEFLAEPTGSKTSEFQGELTGKHLDPQKVAAGTDDLGLGAFLNAMPFAARIGDWFFVHAGDTHGMDLATLDAALRKGVDADGYKASILQDPDSLLEARLHKPAPWWEKPGDGAGDDEKRLHRYVKALGAKHLVIGHQPEKVKFADGTERKEGKLIQKFDGLIFLIDVGMTSVLNYSQGDLLRIRGGKTPEATKINHDGETKRIWPAP